ncbi:MAG: hypothetical protein IPM04_10110 [Saprospiraceae bacterium]|nr:hypothetical protein [Candidatus Brachybacter algidus]MBK8748202.1 hypothetical protein [Candidatus Brachybacter algidus]
MTREFIHRIINILNEVQVEYVITGSVSKYLRGLSISTMDLDIVVQTTENNLSKIDQLKYNFKKGQISDELRKGQIVRINEFPFRFDLLPRLDGLTNDEIFRNREQMNFENQIIPIISESNLITNYQSFKQNE